MAWSDASSPASAARDSIATRPSRPRARHANDRYAGEATEHRVRIETMGLSDFPVEAAIAVSDLQRARQFYEEKLGLRPAEAEEQGVRYRCGSGTGVFIYLSEQNAGTSTATIAGWSVDDLGQTMAELAANGVEFEQYDQPGLKTDERGVFDRGDFKAAWLRDPDGNTLALTEQR
jgi:catechol 2,3-dioxygenase-like lactoylglutathione lyase family enzyme